ncbi:hypothetical protein ACRE_000970 [Hapsidospora chrysogenum ATCC 11550]|uniref:Uncharacterized protein n=1 Tax=Hapsidospora chrysogenum (strain ATCC 11550 / CBS 779.69 / DSM 880 / IAM 14645 / JCM 23072 / IMI 49137) TaxID=857340 RepID=A0A086THR3_HAPC1|nr:hypothetical protein ACRE_000970 [Hapsidospora chrysogenum ATCC 11550]
MRTMQTMRRPLTGSVDTRLLVTTRINHACMASGGKPQDFIQPQPASGVPQSVPDSAAYSFLCAGALHHFDQSWINQENDAPSGNVGLGTGC